MPIYLQKTWILQVPHRQIPLTTGQPLTGGWAKQAITPHFSEQLSKQTGDVKLGEEKARIPVFQICEGLSYERKTRCVLCGLGGKNPKACGWKLQSGPFRLDVIKHVLIIRIS